MIVITGAGGFIGSCLVKELNRKGIDELCLVDNIAKSDKVLNLKDAKYSEWILTDELKTWLEKNKGKIESIIHLGASSSTDVLNEEYLLDVNYKYTKELYEYSNRNEIKFIYASTSMTYGRGTSGFDDEMEVEELRKIEQLNPYGKSKYLCDIDIFSDDKLSKKNIIGLKFFNVYGPNEYHKGDMASATKRFFDQIQNEIDPTIFYSETKDIERDFIYVKDVIKVILFFIGNNIESGLYNVGTGETNTFETIANLVMGTVGKQRDIARKLISSEKLERYQYYTCANLSKLRKVGYNEKFYSVKEGVEEYITLYLKEGKYY